MCVLSEDMRGKKNPKPKTQRNKNLPHNHLQGGELDVTVWFSPLHVIVIGSCCSLFLISLQSDLLYS